MVGRSKEAGGLRASEDASGRHLLLLLHGHPPTAANNGDQLSPGRSLLDGRSTVPHTFFCKYKYKDEYEYEYKYNGINAYMHICQSREELLRASLLETQLCVITHLAQKC